MKTYRASPLKHKGFTLIELGIAMFVLSALLIATTVTLSMYYKRMHVQLVGQQYQAITAALGRYMKQYFSQLIALSPECSQMSLAVSSPLSVSSSIASGACRLTLTKPFSSSVTVVVENGFQPTVDELQKLDLLESMSGTQLQLQTSNVVFESLGSSGAALAARRFGVQISKECAPSGCTSGAQLKSLVFNVQPFVVSSDITRFNFDLEEELLIAGGADAAIASLGVPASGSSYELKGDLYSSQNPIRDYTSSSTAGVGIRGIMAVRNRYDTTLDSDYARRDGTSTMTGDWEFSNFNVSDINILSAKYIDATERVTTNKLYAQHYKLPIVSPYARCNPSLEHLGVDAGDGEIYICRKDNPSSAWGWWKQVATNAPPS